jgi:hypothetical protein
MARRSMRRLLAAKVLLVALLVLTTGCAKKPTMTLKHATVSGVQIGFPPSLGIVMNAVLDVTNPNGYDVAIRAMRGTVVLANRYTLPIDYRAPGDGLWLASDATTTVQVPIAIPVDLALALLRESQMSLQIPFRITGRADVTATRTFKIEKDDYAVDEVGAISRAQVEQTMRSAMPWGR